MAPFETVAIRVSRASILCGIAGRWSFGGGRADDLVATARSMADSLAHRGPDDDGTWVDDGAGVAFGFRRLAIIDLTAAGAQPMHSASGRYVIVFNGEVYNHQRLRDDLARSGDLPTLRGHSDTEVMLACIDAWGLESAVHRFIGMFAFALWDRRERQLSLVRDRAGVKPLYYAPDADGISFASELTAFRRLPDFDPAVSPGAVRLYARLGYVPAPWTICEHAGKLRPGTILRINERGDREEIVYWNARKIAETIRPFEGSPKDAEDQLEALLSDAVSLRLIADVPLGVFLSSGVDSSLVVAQMRKHSSRIRSFTIGFEDSDLDESDGAAGIAAHFGTEHRTLLLRSEEVIGVVPEIAAIYDEPFADTSAIPTFLVSRLARRDVTVALSGDGGDELFGGYHRHFLAERMWNRVGRVPRSIRPIASTLARLLSSLASGQTQQRSARYAAALAGDVQRLHLRDVATDGFPVRDGSIPSTMLLSPDAWPQLRATEAQMFADFVTYLPDDILVKVDRATMAVSLEGREPLLDHRLIEFAWSLPLAEKVGGGEGKRILRRILGRHLPAKRISPFKRGFGPAVGEWLRSPLRDWAEALLPGDDEWFDASQVRRLWREHLAGASHDVALWRVLMFQAWRARTL
ncbi:MAG: asparagine synthase (glutamine-hydrolyzing) [Thermoanaerobaculia bacterium]